MIKILFSLLVIGCVLPAGFAQKNTVDAAAAAIPAAPANSVETLSAYIKQHFETDSMRVRAVYVWIAEHINYDLDLLEQVKSNPQMQPQTAAAVLKSRRTVCQGYALLFATLCNNMGIRAFPVPGYVKIGGRVVSMPHAWVAAELKGDWLLFDPTWGAGYVADNRFVKHFNNSFYYQQPKDMIADHMPFDPLFQLLTSPKTNKEFIAGTTSGSKALFNYRDTLLQYDQLSFYDQTAGALRRMEAAGIENNLLQVQQKFLKMNLQAATSNSGSLTAGNHMGQAVNLLNEYFGHKNKQFSTLSDNDLVNRIDSMKYHIKLARSLVSESLVQNNEQQKIKTANLDAMDKYWRQLDLEDQFVKKYIATDMPSRRQLFMRR